MSKIRTDRIQYLTRPSVYHQFIHGLGKPHHLAPLHFRRHGQSVRICHHVYKYRPVNIHRLFQQHQLDLVPEIELTSNDLLIDLARIGLGIAFIPDYCISKESDGIFTLDMNEEMPERSLVIAYNEQLPLSKATQEFLSCFHPVEE